MKLTIPSLLACMFCAHLCTAQIDLPRTQLFLFQMEKVDTNWFFRNAQFLSGFNPNGYNNQPWFINNDELLLTVAKAGENQTDIYHLDLRRKQILRLTRTAESEYSPKPTPDQLYFTVVRVEVDGERTQRLWRYPMDRKDGGQPLLRYLRNIGYYHWIDTYRLALFNIAEVNYLSLADLRDEQITELAPAIGRCFGTSPAGRLVFVHKITDNNWVLKALDPDTKAVETITQTLPGSEDFAIMADGTIVMGNGSRLFMYHPRLDKTWREVADFKALGITHITRLAISRDNKLVLVNGG